MYDEGEEKDFASRGSYIAGEVIMYLADFCDYHYERCAKIIKEPYGDIPTNSYGAMLFHAAIFMERLRLRGTSVDLRLMNCSDSLKSKKQAVAAFSNLCLVLIEGIKHDQGFLADEYFELGGATPVSLVPAGGWQDTSDAKHRRKMIREWCTFEQTRINMERRLERFADLAFLQSNKSSSHLPSASASASASVSVSVSVSASVSASGVSMSRVCEGAYSQPHLGFGDSAGAGASLPICMFRYILNQAAKTAPSPRPPDTEMSSAWRRSLIRGFPTRRRRVPIWDGRAPDAVSLSDRGSGWKSPSFRSVQRGQQPYVSRDLPPHAAAGPLCKTPGDNEVMLYKDKTLSTGLVLEFKDISARYVFFEKCFIGYEGFALCRKQEEKKIFLGGCSISQGGLLCVTFPDQKIMESFLLYAIGEYKKWHFLGSSIVVCFWDKRFVDEEGFNVIVPLPTSFSSPTKKKER